MSSYIRAFNRFELKYLLHHQTREFLDRIKAHVHPDPNAGRDGFYKVLSLYFDSPDFMCYWEKLDGEKYRRKCYAPSPLGTKQANSVFGHWSLCVANR